MLHKTNYKQASRAMSRLIPGNSGAIFNKSSHTQDLKVSFNFGKDPITQLKSYFLEERQPATKESRPPHYVPPNEIQLWEEPTTYYSYSRGRTTEDARKPHYGACSIIHFQDGPRTYSNFKYRKQRIGTTGAQEQGAIREERKKDFVSLHDFGSRKTKQGRRKTSLYYIPL